MPNLVPLYEEMEACQHANYNYTEWRRLSYKEKAMHVAQYRLMKLVALHGQDAVNTRMERDQKKAATRAKRR